MTTDPLDTVNGDPIDLSDKRYACYHCPITMDIMVDPVISKSGTTYEKTAIHAWINKHHTCPLTREPMTIKELIPNKSLKNTIDQLRAIGTFPPAPEPSPVPVPVAAPSRWVPIVRNNGVREVLVVSDSSSSTVTDMRQVMSQLLGIPMQDSSDRVGGQLRQGNRFLSTLYASTRPHRVHIEPDPEPEPGTSTYHTEPLPPVNLPERPDFQFISSASTREMVVSAYAAVTRLGEWDYVRRYDPGNRRGYMFDRDERLLRIQTEINREYTDRYSNGHSGSTMAHTMRLVQYIAKNGYDGYKEYYYQQ